SSGSSHPMKLQVKAGYEERRIYIGNLPAKVTEDDIRHHFHTFGEIEFVSLKHKTKEQESFCFLGFDSAGAASSAIRQMDGSDAWGSPIKVTLSKPPERKGSSYHRSVEYSDAPRDEGRRRRSRSRRSSRSSSRRPSQGRRSYGASRARPQTRSPGNENSRALLNRPPKEASANRSEKSYSDRESYSDEESEAQEVAPEPRAAAPAPEEPKVEEDQGGESSASSSSSEGEEPDKPTRSSTGRAEEATPGRAPQQEADDEAPSSTAAEGANDAGGRGVVKRRKRRRVNAEGQPERRMKRRRKLPATNKEAVPLETRSRSRTAASPMRPTSPTNERASSPRSEPPEDAAPRKPPLQRKRPEKRGEERGIRVRVENLPSDMTLSELKNTALDFGEVSELKLWKMSDGSKTGQPMRALWAAVLCSTAGAQIYKFKETTVPESKSLSLLYAFFIYDPPNVTGKRAPVTPFVQFKSLKASSTSEDFDNDKLKDYQGLQVHLIKYEDLWSQVDTSQMCATYYDVQQGLSQVQDHLIIRRNKGQSLADVNVYRHQLRFGKKEPDERFVVKHGGVYYLVVSNCGTFDQATISGQIIVKNQHGYLPANEYSKMPFYGISGLVCSGLFVVWVLLCVRWWTQLFNIHLCIAAVCFLAVAESGIWYLFLIDWNSSGMHSNFLFASAVVCSVTRSTASYMLVLLACLGWGVTKPILDGSTICRILCLSFIYIVLNVIREIV
ncbi:Tmem87b, partial [Symbiodinium sp. CCMP2456]